jgi:hypothetical protein
MLFIFGKRGTPPKFIVIKRKEGIHEKIILKMKSLNIKFDYELFNRETVAAATSHDDINYVKKYFPPQVHDMFLNYEDVYAINLLESISVDTFYKIVNYSIEDLKHNQVGLICHD